MEISGGHRQAVAHAAARRLAETAGADGAFVSGSLAAGLGSVTSDIDVYLVGETLTANRRQLYADGVRVDVQQLATGTLDRLVDQVARAELRSGTTGEPLPDPDVTLAVRLWAGQIVTGEPVLAPLRERLTERGTPLRRLVVSKWVHRAFTAFEDCFGLCQSTEDLDRDAALLTARTALISAGKALAAACGDLYLGDKWVWRQLARSAPAAFPLAWFRRLLDGPGPPGEGDHVGDLLSFAQTCLTAVVTLGWQNAGLDRWTAWRTGPGPLRRTGSYVPLAFDDVVVAVGLTGSTFRMGPDTALLWGLCNGSSADAVIRTALSSSAAAPAYRDLTEERCGGILTRLAAAGLTTEADPWRWTR